MNRTFTLVLGLLFAALPLSPADGQPLFCPARLAVLLSDEVRALAVGDYNRDGLADIAAVSEYGRIELALRQVDGRYNSFRLSESPSHGRVNRLEAVDCNGDDILDLLAASSAEHWVYVLHGDGAGGFTRAAGTDDGLWDLGPDMVAGAIGDIDADGRTDLVVLSQDGGDFLNPSYSNYVAFGNGDGTFTIRDTLHTPALQVASVLGDFDGDGLLDAAMGSYYDSSSDRLRVFTQSGDDGFVSCRPSPLGPELLHLRTGDFDGDGRLDLVSAHSSAREGQSELINVHLGAGDGTFPVVRRLSTEHIPFRIRLGDFNEDGRPDLLLISLDGTRLLPGIGAGSFGSPLWRDSLFGVPLVADLDGDSHQDVLLAGGAGLVMLLGKGDGYTHRPVEMATGLEPCAPAYPVPPPSLIAADFDRDGRADLAFGNRCSPTISVMLAETERGFTRSSALSLPNGAMSLDAGDLDGDQVPDLVSADSLEGALVTFAGKGDGTFAPGHSHAMDTSPANVLLADLDIDGSLDAAVTSADEAQLNVLRGDGAGGFTASSTVTLPAVATCLAAGDLNEDGFTDFAAGTGYASGGLPFALLLNDGHGSMVPGQGFDGQFLPVPPGTGSILLTDVDADGHLDLLAGAALFRGSGDGQMVPGINVLDESGLDVAGFLQSVIAGDVTGDARSDLIGLSSLLSGQVFVLSASRSGSFQAEQYRYPVVGRGGTLLSEDLDSDGTLDVAALSSDSTLTLLYGVKPVGHDVAVLGIEEPREEVTTGSFVVPQVRVANRGPHPETFWVRLDIEPDYTDSIRVDDLGSGQQHLVTMEPWSPPQSGMYSVVSTVSLATDGNAANNAVSIQVLAVPSGVPGDGPAVSGIQPSSGGNGGWITTTISGSDFTPDADVRLRRGGHPDIIASGYFTEQTEVLAPERIRAVFDLEGAATGHWDVVVTSAAGDESVFHDGFLVEEGHTSLWVDLSGRSRFMLSAHAETLLQYEVYGGNGGNYNLDNVLLILEVPDWLVVRSIVHPATGDTLLHGDSLAVHDEPAGRIPFWAGTLTPREIAHFQVNVRGDWYKYRDQVIRGQKPADKEETEEEQPGLGLSGLVFDSAKCFGKNLAETYVDKGDVELQDFQHAGEEGLKTLGEGMLMTAVTVTIEILFPWTIPFIEGYSLAQKLLDAPEALMQLTRLAFEFLSLFAEWFGDPNFKEGPVGFGEAGFVMDGRPFFYYIHFENKPEATAAVPYVVIVDTLDLNLDWSTLVTLETSHSLTSVTLDSTTGEVRWRFDDIQLPPNANPPEGEGWLSYRVWPKAGLAAGTSITNRAHILFATQDPETTNQVLNTIDNKAPDSRVTELSDTQDQVTFPVEWYGTDAGSGVDRYTVYVAEDDGPYTPWLETPATSASFTGRDGSRYAFYTQAVDNVGHYEAAPPVPDAITRIDARDPIGVTPNPFVPARGHDVITFFGDSLGAGTIRIFDKAGRLVRSLDVPEDARQLEWDTTASDGSPVASGVYVWVLSGDRHHARGKFAIIR